MTSEQKLLARLERWLQAQPKTPNIFDVLATRDGELFAAYVLNAFRAATRKAVIERLEHQAVTAFAQATAEAANPVMRVFDGLAGAWKLADEERLVLLGIGEPDHLQALRASAIDDVTMEVIERVVILLDIFQALNTLFPVPERADAWLRAPNAAPAFGGRPAIQKMVDEGLEGLRAVRAYLWAQRWSC